MSFRDICTNTGGRQIPLFGHFYPLQGWAERRSPSFYLPGERKLVRQITHHADMMCDIGALPRLIVWLTVVFLHRLDWCLTLDLPWVSGHQSTNRLVRLHAAPQRSAAAWQKQCILVRKFVRLWSALQPPCAQMCHVIKVPWEQTETSRLGQALQLLKISCNKYIVSPPEQM